jgi:TonB family protein
MGIDGSARFRFIVDSLGRVEMPSVEQVQATHDAFAFAVRNTLARMRFTPALVQGKPVRQLVELPFVFRVER